jgi:glutathione peroxidase
MEKLNMNKSIIKSITINSNARENLSIKLRSLIILSLLSLSLLILTLLTNPAVAGSVFPIKAPINENGCPSTLDIKTKVLASSETVNPCEKYKGKLVLIVNTASKCGFTDQFGELEALYAQYKSKGFIVLGFPSNDFGNQDPENEKKIASFCRLTYGVKFPMFEKTHAAEANASAIYKTLGNLSGDFPKWNFHKYLLDREGNLLASFPGQIGPKNKKLVALIESQL